MPSGFYATLEDAQQFIVDEEAQEERQAEEDDASELFASSVSETRDIGEALLILSNVRKNLDDFKIDLAALQNLVQDHPDQSHTNAVESLEQVHLSIRKDWKRPVSTKITLSRKRSTQARGCSLS